MILYSIIAAILVFYALYFTTHIMLSTMARPANEASGKLNHSFVVIGALRPDSKFVSRLKSMVNASKHLPVSWYVVLQDSTSEMEESLKGVAQYVDHIAKPKGEGNPYHKVLGLATRRMKYFANQMRLESSKVILLDVDNEISETSLSRLIQQSNYYNIVQGKRVAKSSDGQLAKMDGLSESLNDVMMRKSRSSLGAPIELSGSGFIIDLDLFDKAVSNFDLNAPGMDKNLLIQILKINPSVSMLFDEDCILFDEKTDDDAAYARQRLRWFGNQYYNARTSLFALLKLAIEARRYGVFDYAISLWRPPRLAQAGISLLAPFIDAILFMIIGQFIPLLSISAIIFVMGVSVFIGEMGMWSEITSLVKNGVRLGATNLMIALKSLSPKLKGTFIVTRQ